jgi:hypothetical protein
MGGAYIAHFAMYTILKIAHMARSSHVCATRLFVVNRNQLWALSEKK